MGDKGKVVKFPRPEKDRILLTCGCECSCWELEVDGEGDEWSKIIAMRCPECDFELRFPGEEAEDEQA
jgi:hypothetical protein